MRGDAPALGIDFGTSNTAVSFLGDDKVSRLIALEGAVTTIPTAVFFNAEDHRSYFGREAIMLYVAGVEGRLMRRSRACWKAACSRRKQPSRHDAELPADHRALPRRTWLPRVHARRYGCSPCGSSAGQFVSSTTTMNATGLPGAPGGCGTQRGH
jgi:hypothetical protein